MIRVAVAYDIDGTRTERMPVTVSELERIEPVYREFPGFGEDITGVRRFEDLPAAAQSYLNALSEIVEVPIRIVSVGPERSQVIRRSGS